MFSLSRWLKTESYRRGIVLSSGLNLFAKGLAFATQLAIAAYFGTCLETDVYFYCIATVMLMAAFINSLNASVLIPESMRLRAQENQESAMNFLNFFFWIYCGLGALITGLLFIDPIGLFTLVSRFDPSKLQQHAAIVMWSIPLMLLMTLVNYLISILTSYKFFTIPMVTNMMNSILSLLFLFLFHDSLGVQSLLLGLLLAYGLQALFLMSLLRSSLDWRFRFRYVAIGRRNLNNIGFALAGNFATVVSTFFPAYLLSGLGQGVVSSLSFGQRVATLPAMLISAQFSEVAAIKFNELWAAGKRDELNQVFLSASRVLLFLLIPISCLIFLYQKEIVMLLFQRGAFDAKSVRMCSLFLGVLGLQLAQMSINNMIARLFMAAQKIKQAFWYQILLNCGMLACVYIGVQWLGPVGFPVGSVVLYTANLLFLGWLLRVMFPFISYHEVLRYAGKILLINLALLSLCTAIKAPLDQVSWLLSLFLGSGLYTSLLLIVNGKWKVNEDAHNITMRLLRRAFPQTKQP